MSIYLIHQHGLVREAITRLLETEKRRVCGSSENIEAAVRDPAFTNANVIVSTLSDPDEAPNVIKRIKAAVPKAALLILSGYADRETVNRCLTAGADGYLLKRATTAELLQAMELVRGGQCYLHPEIVAHVLADIRGMTVDEPTLTKIPPRELQVLIYLAEGLRNSEIAERLFVSRSTVKNHVRSLFKTFSSSDRTNLVVQAMRAGVLPSRTRSESP